MYSGRVSAGPLGCYISAVMVRVMALVVAPDLAQEASAPEVGAKRFQNEGGLLRRQIRRIFVPVFEEKGHSFQQFKAAFLQATKMSGSSGTNHRYPLQTRNKTGGILSEKDTTHMTSDWLSMIGISS